MELMSCAKLTSKSLSSFPVLTVFSSALINEYLLPITFDELKRRITEVVNLVMGEHSTYGRDEFGYEIDVS